MILTSSASIDVQEAAKLQSMSPEKAMIYVLSQNTDFMMRSPKEGVTSAQYRVIRPLQSIPGSFEAVEATTRPLAKASFDTYLDTLRTYSSDLIVPKDVEDDDVNGELIAALLFMQLGTDAINLTKILMRYGSGTFVTDPFTVNPNVPLGIYRKIAEEHKRLIGSEIEVADSVNTPAAADQARVLSRSVRFAQNAPTLVPTVAADQITVFEELDWLVNGMAPKPDVLYLPYTLLVKIGACLRNAGTTPLQVTMDQFTKLPVAWDGVPFVTWDMDDQNYRIIDMDEKQGTTSNTGSIVAIKFGVKQYYWQTYKTNFKYELLFKQLPDRRASLRRGDMRLNHYIGHPRSIRRSAGWKF